METDDRYEVETQLGKMDEAHIIRAIDWRVKRKRDPRYEHTSGITT